MTAESKMTLREAYDDLGWFYATFTALVGGPSLLEILEMIFDLRLVDALQWIVDGYRAISGAIAGYLEPLLRPVLDWLSAVFDWRLELHPHWRPVFMLAMVFVTGLVRIVQRTSMFEAIVFGLLLGIGALAGAVTAGLHPLEGRWWTQGLAAAAPVGLITFMLGAPLAITTAGGPRSLPKPLRALGEVAVIASVIAGIAFALAAGISFMPGVAKGAGLITLSIGLVAIGVVSLLAGLSDADRVSTRIGLTLIGGFATAALIVGVDALLKTMGAN